MGSCSSRLVKEEEILKRYINQAIQSEHFQSFLFETFKALSEDPILKDRNPIVVKGLLEEAYTKELTRVLKK